MKAQKYFLPFLLILILMSSFAITSPALAASACGTKLIVAKGDTLAIIAARCVTTVSALQLANPEIGSGNLIYPGQVLQLPGAMITGSNGYNTYIVAHGDTLKSLAVRFAITLENLAKLNPGISNINLIYEGQRLSVPGSGTSQTPPPAVSGNVYIVQSGDTLKIISARFNTTLEAILKVNPQISNQNLIYVGQVINLPSGTNSYFVQSGDTLNIIAARFGTTLAKLLTLNPVITNPNIIFVGQMIIIR